MKVTFAKPEIPVSGTVIIPVSLGQKLGAIGGKLDKKTGGIIKRAMEAANFTGKRDETTLILAPAKTKLDRIILLGLGKPDALQELDVINLGGAACGSVIDLQETQFTFVADSFGLEQQELFAAQFALGFRLRSYKFSKYKTRKKSDSQRGVVKALTIMCDDTAAAKKTLGIQTAIAEGVEFTRNLVSEPGNVIYPVTLAGQASQLSALGVDVEILDEHAMADLGMGALLGVAQGSVQAPRLVTMHWNGLGDEAGTPAAIVGKGVTFDSGGISLKPGPGMEEMIYDMAGSAAVIGTMHALAKSKAKVNVVGLVGLVENMPDGKAQRPGDIVKSMSGQTIEVHNTDAEGRLVLADVLWYAQERFKPHTIIDLATLTGAILVALGQEYAGLFSNNDKLAEDLHKAGIQTGEKVWRMPMCDAYDKMLDADTADMKNIGGRDAGSATAAHFLHRFIKSSATAWAHLDIAGTAWGKKNSATAPKGATGYGVRLLYQYLTANG